ncbi:MAG TPA: hypothetical protein VNN62_10420 [Methylomirabilota bacterium]|jgi:hypothetical protein|nr:hypothetical protein [Methylomirabilota bacterium]
MPILDPTGSSQEKLYNLAPRRLHTLDGARLGLLGNTKLNADAVLAAIGDLLKERYALKSIIARTKPTFSHPADNQLVNELVDTCDVVIAGVGD